MSQPVVVPTTERDGLLDALEKAEAEREELRTGLIHASEHLRAATRALPESESYGEAAVNAERLAYGGSYPYLLRDRGRSWPV